MRSSDERPFLTTKNSAGHGFQRNFTASRSLPHSYNPGIRLKKGEYETMNLTRRGFGMLAAGAVVAETLLNNWPAEAQSPAPTGDALAALSLAEASAMIHAGKVTSTQLTKACLARIAIYAPKLDCFITIMAEKALAQAAVLDAEQKAGKFRGPLHGIPIALKDNIDTAGTLTTAGSGVFRDRVPTEDAPVVTRLVAAGAVIIGKANLHEFAFSTGEVSYFGPPRNPWNLAHNTGGSSSGSGAAVSADLCYAALGTDTGGSIRMPSAYCSDVGMMATYGLVPIRGIAPLRASLDHCGPLAKTVEDAAMVLNAIAGYDKLDIFSVEHPREDYVAGMKQPVSGFRLGIPKGALEVTVPESGSAAGTYGGRPSAEVLAIVKTAIDLLGTLTAGPAKEVELPSTAGMGMNAETLAYHEEYFRAKSDLYQPPTRKTLEGITLTHQSAEDYIRARWAMEKLRRTVDDAFTDFDLVVMATAKNEPPLLNDMLKRNMENVQGLLPAGTGGTGAAGTAGRGGAGGAFVMNTYDTYGIPSISIPCGFTQDGLPVGLMICGPHFTESKILALAAAYEKATKWHLRKPPITPDTPVPPLITHL
jgi:aspartyl-tRNA(Asn)/glutamyl-tRNA(Gln) amidotransferase subunit A